LLDWNSGLLCAALSLPKPFAYIWNPNLPVKGMKRATSTTATNKKKSPSTEDMEQSSLFTVSDFKTVDSNLDLERTNSLSG